MPTQPSSLGGSYSTLLCLAAPVILMVCAFLLGRASSHLCAAFERLAELV